MVVSTHAQLMCFSSYGRVYWLRVFELPEAGRGASGRPIINLLPLEADERITSMLPVDSYDDDRYIFMATKYGVVKKTVLSNFQSQRSSGLIAVNLDEGDELIGTEITNGENDIMLFTNTGLVNRFSESDVRPTGRGSRGVKGITLVEGQHVISMMLAVEEGVVLIATENGYGKRTLIEEFARRNRGGKGVIGIQTSERNGQIVGASIVEEDDEVMLITCNGVLVRTSVAEVSILGRNTQGVRLIRLDDGDTLVGMSRIEENDADDEMSTDEEDLELDVVEVVEIDEVDLTVEAEESLETEKESDEEKPSEE